MEKTKYVKFAEDRSEVVRGVMIPDGRIVVLIDDNKYIMRYDAVFNLKTGRIVKTKKADGKKYVSLNWYIQNRINLDDVQCFDEYNIADLGYPTSLSDAKVNKIVRKFRAHGFNVTKEAVMHQYGAWNAGFKSGYRDDENGYHLFTPCGRCNEFALCASTLTDKVDWQTTYEC